MLHPVNSVRQRTADSITAFQDVFRNRDHRWLELAWTGWRKVTRFTDYRPGSSEALFLCEKTDELRDGADLADVVTPHRLG